MAKKIPLPWETGGSFSQPQPQPQPRSAGAAPAPFVHNTAQTDPRLEAYAGRVEKRLDNPGESTGRAIDMASSKIRDSAEGQRRAIEQRFGQQGFGPGSGFQGQAELDLEGNVARNIAGSTASIALGRERDEDSFLLGAGPALAAPGAANRQDRSLALEQWQAQEAARRQAEAAALAQQMAILDLLGTSGGASSYSAPASYSSSNSRGGPMSGSILGAR